MNILGFLFGGMVVKNAINYPKEIRDLKNQMPKAEREAFLKQYKQLPGKQKSDFKAALRSADIGAASQILGQDLGKYKIAINKPVARKTVDVNTDDQTPSSNPEVPENDFTARINKILAVPTSIDPELVAEAARKYEEAVPSTSGGSVADKTKRTLEVSG